MAFTNYVPPLLNDAQAGALPDLVSHLLSGYGGTVNAKYLPREKEANIFHKQISPLAMLASSPYFSSLHPQQQQQIAGYIGQMLSNRGMGGQGGMDQMPAMSSPGRMPSQDYTGDGQQMYGPENHGNGGNNSLVPKNPGEHFGNGGNNSLVPKNPGEHFTGGFTQSPYTGGTAHRGSGGETIYAPTGGNVQKGLDIITEAKGLKKLFDEYSKVAPYVGGAGGFKRDLSNVASGIAKTNLPFSKKISEALGGSTLSNAAARAASYKAQMAPALRAIGFSNYEIEDMLKFYPGETEKNIQDRLQKTWLIIERKIKTYQKNLSKGIDVNQNVIGENEPPRSIDQKIARDRKERAQSKQGYYKEAPRGSIGMYKNGELYYIPANKVNDALAHGFDYE